MPGYYIISYNWEHRKRKPNEDVLLEACVALDNALEAEKTLIHWLNDKIKGAMSVDDKDVTCWACDNVLLHYIMSKKSICLYMHSSGPDAFDSLNYCAYEIARIFYNNYPDAEIKWIEHPHKSNNLKGTSINNEL
ncbi:TPA: hypothetical protein O7U53_004843 [Salmonella enterica]|nr:hypothetical protein [Salmonella enterica]